MPMAMLNVKMCDLSNRHVFGFGWANSIFTLGRGRTGGAPSAWEAAKGVLWLPQEHFLVPNTRKNRKFCKFSARFARACGALHYFSKHTQSCRKLCHPELKLRRKYEFQWLRQGRISLLLTSYADPSPLCGVRGEKPSKSTKNPSKCIKNSPKINQNPTKCNENPTKCKMLSLQAHLTLL